MTTHLFVYACLTIGLSAALVGGVFQAFSDFVMAGLIRAAPAGGIDSMQQINRTVFRSAFLAITLALAPIMLAASLYAWQSLEGSPKILILIGTAIYMTAVLGVTMFGNVPMNKHLDGLTPSSPDAAIYWKRFGTVWTGWTHVRTFGAIIAAICFLLAATGLPDTLAAMT